MSFFPEVRLKKSSEHYDWFEVIEDCYYDEIIIPAGFTTDGASVPRLLWSIIPPHGLAFNASVLHDYLYENYNNREARKWVDDMFFQNLIQSNVPIFQAYIMYFYVRSLGWWNWNKFKK